VKNSTSLVAGLLVLTAIGGCTAAGPSAESRTATIALATELDQDSVAQPALIWTIDGEQVPLTLGDHVVPAGTRSFSVMPVQEGSIEKTRNYGVTAQNRGVHIAEMTVDLEAGQQLLVAAVVRRHRTYLGFGDSPEPLEAWQTSVAPYIVSSAF
jgi:hypothetical protein